MRILLLTSLFITTLSSYSQEEKSNSKQKFYFYWGYNRATFTESNIHFKGDEYDFTLKGVKAKDRQSEIALKFLDPTKLSIPQYNYRLGYYLNDKWGLSIGWDHMKYVMVSEQEVTIDGFINATYNETYGEKFNNTPFAIDKSFLQLEHTDGLNYINPQVDRIFTIWKSKNEKQSISNSIGLGAGIMVPRSDVTLMHNERNDVWHLAGYGLSANTNMRLTFLKNFFLEYNLKGGFINMVDVNTTSSKSDKANHSFLFLERFGVGGFTFSL